MEVTRLKKDDLWTMIAISVIVYALSSFLHEGVGHGGACLLVGCHPKTLSSMHFDGSSQGLSLFAQKLIPAGGPIISTAVGVLCFGLLQRFRTSATAYYFVWLLASVNLMQGTGYFVFSGFSGIGDLAAVTAGWQPPWFWRIVLIVLGFVTYYRTVEVAMRRLGPLIGGDATERVQRAQRFALTAFLTGGIFGLCAGLFNPMGIALVLISGLPATLGGTSGLAWGPQTLRGKSIPPTSDGPMTLPRNIAWIVSAVILGAVFVALFGPGLHFP